MKEFFTGNHCGYKSLLSPRAGGYELEFFFLSTNVVFAALKSYIERVVWLVKA